MRGNYKSPSELLLALRETGKSYWDLVGKPLTPNTGYNLNNPHAAEESEYNKWYNGSKLSDEDSEKLQLFLEEYDKSVKSNTDNLPSYKGGKDKFHAFAAKMGPRVYKELHRQGRYTPYVYDNMMRQLAWESNYGTSLNAVNNHNYAGIRANPTKYVSYKNEDEFVKSYVTLLNKRYPNAMTAKSAKQFAKALKANGYYEDSLEHYSNSLAAMSSISNAVRTHMNANPSLYEIEVLLDDLKKQDVQPAVSTRVVQPIVKEPINKEPNVNTPINTGAPLITRPLFLESNSIVKRSFELNMQNMLLGKEFEFNLPGFKKGKNPKKPLSDEQYIKIMEDVANENYESWGLPNQDAALLEVLNSNVYDYRGYYNKYPPKSANSLTHWPDEFKTVYHPSFSDESKYSGYKNKYNPDGIVGGHWYNEIFVPSLDQLRKLKKLPGFTGGKNKGYVGNAQTAIGDYVGRITNNTNSAIVGDGISSALSLVPHIGIIPSAMDLGRDLNRAVHAEDEAVKDAALDALSMLPFLNKITLKKKGPVKNIFDRVGRYMRKTTTRSKYNNAVGSAKVLDVADDTKNSVKLANQNFSWKSTIKRTTK